MPLDSKIYLSEDGVTEIQGPGYEDLRFFIIAMVDPFDLIGLAMGRHTRKDFWKEDPGRSKAENEEAGQREEDAETVVASEGHAGGTEVGVEEVKVLEKVVVVDNRSSSGQS